MKRQSTSHIVIHTTASNSFNTPEQVQNFFLRILYWGRGGYHTIYGRDGNKREFYNWRDQMTYGILPDKTETITNNTCIHLSYVGGIRDFKANEAICNITESQEKEIVKDIKSILKWYPNAKIIGHNQINAKYCPSFWVPMWAEKHGFKSQNIDYRDDFNLQKQVLRLPHPINFYE